MKLLLLLLIITSLVTSCFYLSSWNREDPLGNKLTVINQMIKDEKIIEEDYDKTCFYSNPRADGIKKNHKAYRYVNFYHLKNEAVTYTALEYFMSFPSHFRSLFEMKINKTIQFTKTINSSSKNSINQYYQSTSNFSSLNLEVLHCERTKTNIHQEYKVYVSSIRIAPKQLIYDLYHTFASEKFLRDIYKIIKEQQH